VLPPNPTTAPHGGEAWREDVALERIADLLEAPLLGLARTGWGDDAAVLERPAGRVLVCCDAGVEGVHLDTSLFPIADLGYRTAIAALSDVAAMGGRPSHVVVSICAPGDVDVVAIERGVAEACATVGCTVVGGDLSKAAVTSVTVCALGDEPPSGAVTRRGATPGDALFVTGPLGGAAMGLRRRRAGAGLEDPELRWFRRPRARIDAGLAAAASGATAMLDVSDGLARDVRRLAAASGVGIDLETVPLCDGATLEEGLGGGEDYELVFSHPGAAALAMAFESANRAAPIRIGTITADVGEVRLGGEAAPDLGWRH
jgi:thiamine-monophosphate kinase